MLAKAAKLSQHQDARAYLLLVLILPPRLRWFAPYRLLVRTVVGSSRTGQVILLRDRDLRWNLLTR